MQMASPAAAAPAPATAGHTARRQSWMTSHSSAVTGTATMLCL